MRCCVVLLGLLIFSSSAAPQEPSSPTLAPRAQATACLVCSTRVAAQRHIPDATSPALRAPITRRVMSDAHGPRQVRGAIFGALWGGGVGLFLGAVMGSQLGSCGGEGPCGLGGLGGAVVGGIAGALLGAILGYHLTDDDAKSGPTCGPRGTCSRATSST